MPPITRSRSRKDRLAALLVPPPLDPVSLATTSSLVEDGRPAMPRTRGRARKGQPAALLGPSPLDLVSSALVGGGRPAMQRIRGRATKNRPAALLPPPLDLISSALVGGGRPAMPWTRSRARRERESLERVPGEVLHEILDRLPAKSVLRCRAVCQLWRRLTSNPAFLLDHHGHQPELPMVCSFGTNTCHHDAYHLRAAELQRLCPFPDDSGYSITASCDGLLILDDNYIFNSATHQCALVRPTRNIRNLVGFFRHQPSGEFRVLYWKRSKNPSHVGCENEYRILTVGSSHYRVLPDAPLNCGDGPRVYGALVLLHGSLYMHLMSRSDLAYHRIRVFHTVAESFHQIRPPTMGHHEVMHLFDMDGMLAVSISHLRMTELSIFMLQDHEHGGWAFQYLIKLPVMDIRRFQEYGDWWANVVSKEGNVLVSCDGWLLHCDKKGNLVANFRYGDDFPRIVLHRLKESLIQHTFFEKTRKN